MTWKFYDTGEEDYLDGITYRPPTAHQICVGAGIYFTTLAADKARPKQHGRLR